MNSALDKELVHQVLRLTTESRLKWSYRGRKMIDGRIYDRVKVIDLPKDSIRIELLNNPMGKTLLHIQSETVCMDTIVQAEELAYTVYEKMLTDVYEERVQSTIDIIKNL